MRTSRQRKEAFMEDFQALLRKHDAECDITDDGAGYGMQTGMAVISMVTKWDDDGEITDQYTDFDLPTWSDGT